MSTNTHIPPPACENCGRDKSPTYICDACCGKLNAATRAITAERDEWKRRMDAVVALLEPAPDEKLQKMYVEDLHVEYAIRELYPLALAIAEGRDNG